MMHLIRMATMAFVAMPLACAIAEPTIEPVMVTAERTQDDTKTTPIAIEIFPIAVDGQDKAVQIATKNCVYAKLPSGGYWWATLNDGIWDVRYLMKDDTPDCVRARVRIFRTTGQSDGCMACLKN